MVEVSFPQPPVPIGTSLQVSFSSTFSEHFAQVLAALRARRVKTAVFSDGDSMSDGRTTAIVGRIVADGFKMYRNSGVD